MKISTKGRYALRIMIDLARQDSGEYIRLKDISARQGITLKYMEQIMPLLTRAGYVKGYRGNNGGYRLTRDPEEYTAGEILRTTEGNLVPVSCLKNTPNQCERKDECATLAFWEGLWKVIDDYVDSVTLADLLKGNIFPDLLDKKRNEDYTTDK
ncbi:MAG: Rrf2 family transcriptional regulator [Lachnospiraceae bacterium]